MAKLLKLRRGTTTQHGSFTGAEGEVTIDTTKDTAVVHCGSVAGGHPLAKENLANVSSSTIAGRLDNDSITPAKIGAGTLPSDVTVASANLVDGTIVNADINAAAAIANSKLADSGVSAGTVGSSTAIPIVTVNSKGIVTATSTTAVDSTTIANGTSNVAVANNGNITVTRAGSTKLNVVGGGVDITGDAAVTGSVTATGSLTVDQGAVIKGANDTAGILELHSDRGDDNPDKWRFIAEASGSELNVQNYNNGAWQNNLRTTGSAGVDLYHTNGIKASTTGSGFSVTGNLSVSGSGTLGDSTITSAAPTLNFDDTNSNPDYRIINNSGSFEFQDKTNSYAARIKINSDGHVDIPGNLDAEGGIDVTGNITCTGTVDGVDIAARNTLFGGLTSSSGVLTNGVTATTQSAGDNSTKVATTAYTDTAVSNLVDSSPGALNTLNELAAAINDDASFSTTMTNNLATKMPLSGGEFTGNVTSHSISPDGNNTRSLGTSSLKWHQVHATNFYGSGANLTGIVSFVSGMILLWSGAENAIPSGWVLCNGSNSTPDLRDRFVVGAGSSYSVGATGGAVTATDTVSITGTDTVNISVSGNAATSSAGAYSEQSTHFSNSWQSLSRVYYNYSRGQLSLPFSGSGSDTVSITGTDTVSIDTRSPYYALCYIMKS